MGLEFRTTRRLCRQTACSSINRSFAKSIYSAVDQGHGLGQMSASWAYLCGLRVQTPNEFFTVKIGPNSMQTPPFSGYTTAIELGCIFYILRFNSSNALMGELNP